MAVTLKGQTAVYEGTSTDTKPTDADNNSIFKELDTGIRYYYDGTDWNEIPRSSGGGGGFTPTETQLAAINSGIDSTKVAQIETNKSNILSEQAKTVGMTAGGTDYITVNGIRVYVSATQPTGDIPVGSLWIGG